MPNIRDILNTAETEVTFWGARVINLAGNRGSVSLDTIASKVAKMARHMGDCYELERNDRLIGLEIVRKIKHLYQATDAQISRANFLTRFFVNFIEWISFNTGRSQIEDGAELMFRGYSRESFLILLYIFLAKVILLR